MSDEEPEDMGEPLAPEEEPLHPEKERPPEDAICKEFLQKWDRSLSDERRHFGLKLLFAGAESKKVRDGLLRIGVKHILVSYFYLRKWLAKATVQEVAEDLGRFDFVFLDSGGFSFLDAKRQGKDLGIDTKEYADQYYVDLEKVGHLFAGCAEVDIRDDLGHGYMEQKERECLGKGIPIVPVIQGAGLEEYDAMGWFNDYPYLAVGSALSGPEWAAYLGEVYKKCKERGILLHGFGMTGAQTILRSQYYSVDSTSWTGGSRFGTTMVFENGRIRHYDKLHKDVRKRFKRRFEEAGVIWADIEADKGFEVDMMNALAWKQWADYLRYTATRCYWLNPEERDKALSLKSKAFNAEGLIDRRASIQRAQFRRLAVVDDPSLDDRGHETLHCDSCHVTGRCPRFKPNQSCGYDINVSIENHLDMQKAIRRVLEIEYGRVMTATLFEKLEGGVVDRNLSNEMQVFMSLLSTAKDIFDPREELTIKAKGGHGSIATMLASVFAPSGSGNTPTQRAANASGRVVIDALSEPGGE